MSNKKVSQEFLKSHLAKEIINSIDIENIELQPRDFINEIREELIVDVLLKTIINGSVAYLYCIVEHGQLS